MPSEPSSEPSSEPQKEVLLIYSVNGNEIGKMLASEEGVVVDFGGEQKLEFPRREVKAANAMRVGRIGLDSYVMRIFISTVLAAKLRKEFSEIKLVNPEGIPYPPAFSGTITGEYAEFFISSKDVFGVNARGAPAARAFMNVVNGTSPERLRLPE
ncbi:MAG: hypothetical protein V1820_06045 [archaeon]